MVTTLFVILLAIIWIWALLGLFVCVSINPQNVRRYLPLSPDASEFQVAFQNVLKAPLLILLFCQDWLRDRKN